MINILSKLGNSYAVSYHRRRLPAANKQSPTTGANMRSSSSSTSVIVELTESLCSSSAQTPTSSPMLTPKHQAGLSVDELIALAEALVPRSAQYLQAQSQAILSMRQRFSCRFSSCQGSTKQFGQHCPLRISGSQTPSPRRSSCWGIRLASSSVVSSETTAAADYRSLLAWH